jgi:hypothetical protein
MFGRTGLTTFAAVALTFIFACGRGEQGRAGDRHGAHQEDIAAAETSAVVAMPDTMEVIYSCPMHPQVVRSAPGKCSICGMDLVAKHVSSDSTAGGSHDHSDSGHEGHGH